MSGGFFSTKSTYGRPPSRSTPASTAKSASSTLRIWTLLVGRRRQRSAASASKAEAARARRDSVTRELRGAGRVAGDAGDDAALVGGGQRLASAGALGKGQVGSVPIDAITKGARVGRPTVTESVSVPAVRGAAQDLLAGALAGGRGSRTAASRCSGAKREPESGPLHRLPL